MKVGRAVVEVEINPGEFVFGRKSAAKELEMPESSVRNRMQKLKNIQNVDIKEDSHYSIISIINWIPYQTLQAERGQQRGQPEDSRRTQTIM